jgi:hypothetical protein
MPRIYLVLLEVGVNIPTIWQEIKVNLEDVIIATARDNFKKQKYLLQKI